MKRPLMWIGIAGLTLIAISSVVVCQMTTPIGRFKRATGLSSPGTAHVVRSELMENGPFGTDGIRGIELKVDQVTIARWMLEKPFAGAVDWQRGPMSAGDGYFDMPPESILNSTKIFYASTAVEKDGSATLVAIDTESERAWLVEWW